MEGIRLVFAAAALFSCAGAASAGVPFVSSSAPEGVGLFESAVLTCNYSDTVLQFGDTVQWLKDGSTIVSMSSVTPAWQSAVIATTDAKLSVVNISAISATVGGVYTCVVQHAFSCSPSCSVSPVSIFLPVYGPPLAVTWREASGNTLVATAGQSMVLRLDVLSLYNVSSSVSVTLGSRDITNTFVPSVSVQGTEPTNYTVTFTSSLLLRQSTDDGAVLNATVAVPMYSPISSAVKLVVVALPNVSCPGQIQATAGDNVRISCTVLSNPPATIFNWTNGNWSIVDNGTSVDSRLKAQVQEGSRGYYTAVLDIFNVSIADFRLYSLDVTNDVGNSTQTVRIAPGIVVRTTPVRLNGGACSFQHFQHLTLAVTALAAIFGISSQVL